MAQQNILPGNPPIVWSTVDEAFRKINANFTELYLSIGGSGADLTNLSSSLIPDTDEFRDLGSPSKRWRDLYLSSSSLYLGSAKITSDELGRVNLPAGSTVGGDLIRNPNESNFKTIRVSGQSDVVANDFQGILNLSGVGIGVTTDSSTDTITFSNSGVTGLASGNGISVNSATGNVTVSNTGVLSLTGGTGIGVSSPNGDITLTNTGVTRLVAGSGVVLDGNTGVITITNSAPNIAQNVYRFLAVSGQPVLDPSGPTSTLSIIANQGISILSEPLSNTMTFSNTGVTSLAVDNGLTLNSGTGDVTIGIPEILERNLHGDVRGSVYADDSSLLVDGTEGKIVGEINSSLANIETLEVTNILYSNSLSNPNISQLEIYSAGSIYSTASDAMYFEVSQAFAGNGGSMTFLAGSGSDPTEIMNGSGGNIYMSAGHGPFGPEAVGGSVFISGGNGVVSGGNIVLSPGDIGQGTAGNVIINNLTYPKVDGSPGQILSTDGSGILSWIDPPVSYGGGGGGSDFLLFVAADDSTQHQISTGESIKFIGGAGIDTSSDAEGNITITNTITTGNITFATTTIDSTDSSGIVIVPAVTLNSDLTVENDLNVSQSIYAKEFHSTGVGTPELYSETNIDLTAGTVVNVTSSPLRLARFTTTQRNALVPQNGDLIYNTTVNKFQGYQDGAWINLDTGSAA